MNQLLNVSTPISPDELQLLQDVFDQILSQRGLEKTQEDAVVLAAELVRLYELGVRDSQSLRALVS